MESTFMSGILTLIAIIGLLLFSMRDSGSKKSDVDSKQVQ